jgi:hypothetical protein
MIPAQVAGTLVQCPHCATTLDISAALQSAQAAAPRQPAGYPAYPTAPLSAGAMTMAPAGTIDAPTVSTASTRALHRRRKNTVIPWLVLGLVIFGGVGIVIVGVKLVQKQRSQAVAHSKPSQAAFEEAKGFVASHLQAAEGHQFAEGYKARKRGGRWAIQGEVLLPTQSGGMISQPWLAEIKQLPDQTWTLERLEIDRDEVFSTDAPFNVASSDEPGEDGEEIEEFKFINTNANRPNSGDSVFGTASPMMPMAGPDYYQDQTIGWAVKQVSEEIKTAVELRKTLVIWLVDQSASAAMYRSELQAGLNTVYQDQARGQKGDKPGDSAADEAPLLSAVGIFGKEVAFPIETPTANPAEIESAIAGITEDASGSEMPLTAVKEAVEKFLPFRTDKDRYLMVVLVTDEAGDDENLIEPVLELLKKNSITVSVVGSRAPFGRRMVPGVMSEVSADFGQGNNKGAVLMHQGPETPRPEHINLAFWNPNFAGDDTELLDSGFGPYTLTRLAQESGGTYYACRADFLGGMQAGRSANYSAVSGFMHTFDPKVMRKYAPQYISPEEYEKQLQENKARRALVDAAKLPRVETMKFVRLDFPRLADEAQQKRALDEAQKAAANVEPRIEALYQALKAGEADRPKLTGANDKRWQAGFDLAMGRVLAAKVRTEGYNAMLAQVKGGFTFKDPMSDVIRLQPSEKISAGSTFDRMLKDSRKYLQRVIDEHPDTPWAMLAKRELDTPMGWEWVEQRAGGAMPAGGQ